MFENYVMKCLFRVDSSDSIGAGHISRCLVLAEYLRSSGVLCVFACKDLFGNFSWEVEAQDFIVETLKNEDDIAREFYWCVDLVKKYSVDWLIIDHYDLGFEFEVKMHSIAPRIFVIEDFLGRLHQCDVLLNQSASAEGDINRQACLSLLGPAYSLINPVFVLARKNRAASARIRIFVYFGGSDQSDIAEKTLSALRSLQNEFEFEFDVDFVIEANYTNASRLIKFAEDVQNVRVMGRQANLGSLMAAADLAIGGAGGTAWERCCVGLPSLIVVLSDNQKVVAEYLIKNELALFVGEKTHVTASQLKKTIKEVLEGVDLKAWSRMISNVVDGKGAARVGKVLMSYCQLPVPYTFRNVRLSDSGTIHSWANDPVVRKNAFNQTPIDFESHGQWFIERLTNSNCVWLMAMDSKGLPVGQFRFEKSNQVWRISYSLASRIRGKNLGATLLNGAIQIIPSIADQSVCLQAYVKAVNLPSRKVFERLGFSGTSTTHNFEQVMLYSKKVC